MVWGTAGTGGAVTDLLDKIRDGNQKCMYILSIRKLTHSNAVEIAKALKENKTIIEFYASGHDIGLEGIQAFSDMLKYNTTIQKLCIGHSSMGDDAISILCNGLMDNTGLIELDLEHKIFGIVGMGCLSNVIKIHPTLQSLNVSRNQLNDDSINLLCQSLQVRQTPSMSIKLDDNSFGLIGVEALSDTFSKYSGAEALSDTFPKCSISLAHNNLTNGQETLGKAIVASNISYINLESCSLSSNFIKSMDEGITKQHLIAEINLRHNNLSLDGMKYMENILRNGSQLRKIHLGYNNLQDDGALELVTALQNTNNQLDVLDLSYNNLTCTSINKIFQLKNIKELLLFKNNLGSGAKDVTEGLMSNTSLEVLDLCVNGLHGEHAACILDCLASNTHLKVLELGGNNLNDVGRASLEKLKVKNPLLNVAVNKKGDGNQN